MTTVYDWDTLTIDELDELTIDELDVLVVDEANSTPEDTGGVLKLTKCSGIAIGYE